MVQSHIKSSAPAPAPAEQEQTAPSVDTAVSNSEVAEQAAEQPAHDESEELPMLAKLGLGSEVQGADQEAEQAQEQDGEQEAEDQQAEQVAQAPANAGEASAPPDDVSAGSESKDKDAPAAGESTAKEGAASDAKAEEAKAEEAKKAAAEGEEEEKEEEGGEEQILDKAPADMDTALEGELGTAMADLQAAPVDSGGAEAVGAEAVSWSDELPELSVRLSGAAVPAVTDLAAPGPRRPSPQWNTTEVKDKPDLTEQQREKHAPRGHSTPTTVGPQPFFALEGDFDPGMLQEAGEEGFGQLAAEHNALHRAVLTAPGAEQVQGLDLDMPLPSLGGTATKHPAAMPIMSEMASSWSGAVTSANLQQQDLVQQGRASIQTSKLTELTEGQGQLDKIHDVVEQDQGDKLDSIVHGADAEVGRRMKDWDKASKRAKKTAKKAERKATKLLRKGERMADRLPRSLRRIAKRILRRFRKKVSRVFNKVNKQIHKQFDRVRKQAQKAVDALRKKVLTAYDKMKADLEKAIDTVRNEVVPMLVDRVKETTNTVVEQTRDGLKQVGATLKEQGQSLVDKSQKAIEDAAAKAQDGMEQVGDLAKSGVDKVKEVGSDAWKATSDAGKTVGNGIVDTTKDAIAEGGKAAGTMRGAAGTVGTAVQNPGESWDGALEDFKTGMTTVGRGALDTTEKAVAEGGKAAKTMKKTANTVGDGIADTTKDAIAEGGKAAGTMGDAAKTVGGGLQTGGEGLHDYLLTPEAWGTIGGFFGAGTLLGDDIELGTKMSELKLGWKQILRDKGSPDDLFEAPAPVADEWERSSGGVAKRGELWTMLNKRADWVIGWSAESRFSASGSSKEDKEWAKTYLEWAQGITGVQLG